MQNIKAIVIGHYRYMQSVVVSVLLALVLLDLLQLLLFVHCNCNGQKMTIITV